MVGLGVFVLVGVGEGPGVIVEVGVLVGVGVFVLVGVFVTVGVYVAVFAGKGRQVPIAPRLTCSNSEVAYLTEIVALPAVLNEMLCWEPRSNEAETGDLPGSLIV